MPTAQLPIKDIHVPDAIGWWPPALGWWLLAALAIMLIAGAILMYKRLTRKTAVKTARKVLVAIKQDTSLDSFQQLTELSSLLRRVAVSYYPRAEIASLTGRQWLEFLDRSVKGSPFTEGVGQILSDSHYRRTPPQKPDMTELFRLCEDWLNAQTKQAPSTQRKK